MKTGNRDTHIVKTVFELFLTFLYLLHCSGGKWMNNSQGLTKERLGKFLVYIQYLSGAIVEK